MDYQLSISDQKRFWEKVDVKGAGDCWLWIAGKCSFGYGNFVFLQNGKKRHVNSHRIAYRLGRGLIGYLWVLHRCDVPECCNPLHLFLGTHTDNVRDMHSKGRWNGQQRLQPGEDNPFAKLREIDIHQIRKLINGGIKQKDVAAEYDVTAPTISAITRGLTWTHI